MNYRIFIISLFALLVMSCNTADNNTAQQAYPGKIDFYENFASEIFRPANVLVWLPEDYNTETKYAVLYMHDAQMLFDETTSWNKKTWNVDSVASAVQRDGRCRPFIVVGIENHPTNRLVEYMPEKVAQYLPEDNKLLTKLDRANFMADEYVQFLVNELKPYIDSHYSTLTDAENTVIMGSSMGGLISLYAMAEYPDVFGAAGCLSTHTPVAVDMVEEQAPIWSEAFRTYLTTALEQPMTNKVYMDYGDQTLDAAYAPFQAQFDEMFASLGWDETNYMTRFFPGHAHDETSWQERLNIPLEWLLDNK